MGPPTGGQETQKAPWRLAKQSPVAINMLMLMLMLMLMPLPMCFLPAAMLFFFLPLFHIYMQQCAILSSTH
jgi:hypothetical protein